MLSFGPTRGPNPPGPPSLKGRGERERAGLMIADAQIITRHHSINSIGVCSPLPLREGGPGGLGQAWVINPSNFWGFQI